MAQNLFNWIKFKKWGNISISLCVAFGSLIIKEKCGYKDEKTVEKSVKITICSNLSGTKSFHPKAYARSLMVEFRRRIYTGEIQHAGG